MLEANCRTVVTGVFAYSCMSFSKGILFLFFYFGGGGIETLEQRYLFIDSSLFCCVVSVPEVTYCLIIFTAMITCSEWQKIRKEIHVTYLKALPEECYSKSRLWSYRSQDWNRNLSNRRWTRQYYINLHWTLVGTMPFLYEPWSEAV
jgi:hypothetical protein